MAWTTPPTFTDGSVLTASQLNILRDDLNATAAGAATSVGSMFIGAGANSLVERLWARSPVNTAETTASTSYVELTTPQQLTLTTSNYALIIITARLFVGTVDAIGFANNVVNGATTMTADDNQALIVTSSTVNARVRASVVRIENGLTAGSNVFKMVFKTTAGTLTAASREMLILPM